MIQSTLNYIIRTANEFDAEAIALVHVLSWQKMYQNFIPEHYLKNLSVVERKQLWYELISMGVKILVIENNEQIVGFASVCQYRAVEADQTHGEISAIYLHPDFWRKGLGTRLSHAALLELKQMGFNEIFLWVLEENNQARRFYESIGFSSTNSVKSEEYVNGVILEDVLYKKGKPQGGDV